MVYQFCRQSQYAASVTPLHGRFVGAAMVPFSLFPHRPGERGGLNWRVPAITGKRAVRHVAFDVNYWKSSVHSRLAVAKGDAGCLSLSGKSGKRAPADLHRMLADHLTAEYRITTEGRGRTLEEWKLRLAGSDNHWLDCAVGCAVAASMEGVSLPVTQSTKPCLASRFDSPIDMRGRSRRFSRLLHWWGRKWSPLSGQRVN